MADQVQLRRGTALQHATFTGAVGELTYVTDTFTARLHDGLTAGGYELVTTSKIGSSVQGYDATLQGISDIGVVGGGQMIYGTGSDAFSVIATSSIGRSVLNIADAAELRTIADTEQVAGVVSFQNNGTTLSAGNTLYVATGRDSATESSISFVVSRAGTLKNLYIKTDGSPGAGQSFTFTVMLNGVATSMAVVISDANTSGNDTSNTVTVAAGDRISLRSVASASSGSAGNLSGSCVYGD